MKRIVQSVVVTVSFGLASCQAVKPIPGASWVAPWQKQFAAFDCNTPRKNFDMPSTEPMVFAMASVCGHVPKVENKGWESLVTVDARTNEVRAVRITSIRTGGVHFTDNGHVVWYSAGKLDEDRETRKYAEAYTLVKGEFEERLLGRIDLLFVPAGITFVRGDICHLVTFHNDRNDSKDPYLYQHVLVRDNEPFASAKPLDGVGRALFWDAARRNFVVQKEQRRRLGLPTGKPLDRYGINCSGESVALDAETSRRLDSIIDENATYVMSSKGDLLVQAQSADSDAEVVSVFRDKTTKHISPIGSYEFCPDFGCPPLYPPVDAGPWSPSGEYFMVEAGLWPEVMHVYRTADLQMVKQWEVEDSETSPAYGFINDNVAYQFNHRSRLTFQTW